MRRISRRQRRRRWSWVGLLLGALAGGGWLVWPDEGASTVASAGEGDLTLSVDGKSPEAAGGSESPIPIATIAPELASDEVLEPIKSQAVRAPDADRAPQHSGSAGGRIAAVLRKFGSDKPVQARDALNRILLETHDEQEETEARKHLKRLADQTIFSKRPFADDPLVGTYTIKPGDSLARIGRQFKVPYEIIMRINGILDGNHIREGQKIKVPHGPFHAKIHVSKYRIDLFLQDVFVHSFPVGLGVDQGTPLGVWKVKNHLPNPTYYPPASAENKRIIAPDDPLNPLGEHWIGLTGIEGDAAGRDGYGIHGTIKPDSIGKAVSLGCVRMLNQDVAIVYELLQPGHSVVTTLP